MNNKLAATMIAIGSVIAAQFAASAANYVSHELFYSGKGLDEGAAFSASIVGALTWVAVFGFGLNWAYKTFKGPKH